MQILDTYPKESGQNNERLIPYLPGERIRWLHETILYK
jgi:hypothetical protein